MKWLQGNPLGIALVAVGGFLALLVLGMAIVWSLPVSVDIDDTVSGDYTADTAPLIAGDAGQLNDYQVVDERPLFNETRAPEIVVVDDVVEEDGDTTVAVTDAPDVKLTGVIITPGMKIASLTPADTKLESVMAHEGQSLTGDFVGWQVSSVNPRNVVLESSDGQKLELELQVHDQAIKEPPKPKPAAQTAQADKAEADQPASSADDDQPLSRAEQIRQRIAERREELRREQEAQQADQEGSSAASPRQANNSSAYQNAIQAKLRNSRKDKSSEDDDDG